MTSDDPETLGSDILTGVPEIARFTGEPERRARYLLERGILPGGQMGSIWIASKKKLREHYDRITAGNIA
jgi:hypothetical protein